MGVLHPARCNAGACVFGGDMTAFDWLCLALAVSVTANLILFLNIGRLWVAVKGADVILQGVLDNKVRLERKPNGKWTAELNKGE